MLIYDIESIPDLTLSKYQVFADSGIEGMLDAQTQFIRFLHRPSLLNDVGIHFLFDYCKDRPEGKRIKIRLLFSSKKSDADFSERFRKIVSSSGISDYFSFSESKDHLDYQNGTYKTMCYLKKKERFLETVINYEKLCFYVVPNWKVKDDARLYHIFKLMEAFNENCCYRVDLYAVNELEETIHKAFKNSLMYLRNTAKHEEGFSEKSKKSAYMTDPNASETLKQYEEWLKKVDMEPIFLCRICSFTDDEQYAKLLVDSVVSETLESGNGNLEVKYGNFWGMEELDEYPSKYKYSDEKTPESFKQWPATFALSEVAALCRFPVLYDGENIELPKETSALHKENGMVLGKDANGHKVRIPLEMLPKHMFVCGVPGSGKTNTMLHLANSLWNCHIPFLVLEPAKREYRELASFDIPELILFSPSANTDFPLKINPFEFPVGLTLSEHIGKLCQVFEGAFPIPAPAPFILDTSIQAVYEKHGWNAADINKGEKEYPTLSELYEQFQFELENTNYDGEMKGNIRSVLEVRIGSLLRRELKEMFDVPKSTLLPEQWLQMPVVIELEALGEGPANFTTLLLCTLIRETLKVNPLADKDKPVRHVIFMEEAHNLISPESQADKPENSNPKIAATAFVVKMLAEVRALREGIIIADQLPTAMAPEVIKNTNIKIVHRLTSQDDRELVGSTMSASSLQLENMAVFQPGHALFFYEDLLRPFDMQVETVPKHGKETPDDVQLWEWMMDENRHPAYVNLCRGEETEKWRIIKDKIRYLIEKADCFENSISNISFHNVAPSTVEKYIEIAYRRLAELEHDKNMLHSAVVKISDVLISQKDKEEVMAILERVGVSYCKSFYSRVYAWTKGQEVQ